MSNGGLVTVKGNVARVDGSIAVSRAIGDIKYKDNLIPVPEVSSHQLDTSDDLLVMSTDGLFQVYNEAEAARKIYCLR